MARLKDWGSMIYGFFDDLFFAARLDFDFSDGVRRIIYEPLEYMDEKGVRYDTGKMSLGKLSEGTYEEEKDDFLRGYKAIQTFFENAERAEKYEDCLKNNPKEDFEEIINDRHATSEEGYLSGRAFEREMIWQDEIKSVLPYGDLKAPIELLTKKEEDSMEASEGEKLRAYDMLCCIKEPKEMEWIKSSFIEAEKENDDIYLRRDERKLEEQKRELILKSADAQKREAMADIKIEMVNTSESAHGIDIDETMDMLSERLCELMAKSADGLYL